MGQDGEALAAAWYAAHGYEVLARNWRSRGGEIDLIVRRGTTVVFCEVKSRSSTRFGAPVEAVTAPKQARIRRLAAAWFTTGGGRYRGRARFDVAAVLDGRIEVLEAAF